MKVSQLFESARMEALEFQQALVDEGFETKLQASTWVMRNTYGGSAQMTDVDGGVLLLAKKEGKANWSAAYQFPADSSMGVAMFCDDPGNKHKHVPGHPNLAFATSIKPGSNLKRWGMPE